MYIPALDDLARDTTMRGAPTNVYLALIRYLDDVKFRPVKRAGLARQLKMHPHTVTRALALLEEQGYLESGPFEPGTNISTYKIMFTREITDHLPSPARSSVPRRAAS